MRSLEKLVKLEKLWFYVFARHRVWKYETFVERTNMSADNVTSLTKRGDAQDPSAAMVAAVDRQTEAIIDAAAQANERSSYEVHMRTADDESKGRMDLAKWLILVGFTMAGAYATWRFGGSPFQATLARCTPFTAILIGVVVMNRAAGRYFIEKVNLTGAIQFESKRLGGKGPATDRRDMYVKTGHKPGIADQAGAFYALTWLAIAGIDYWHFN